MEDDARHICPTFLLAATCNTLKSPSRFSWIWSITRTELLACKRILFPEFENFHNFTPTISSTI